MCEWLASAEWCDVRLVCGGRAFSAHRAVLASVSTFLKQIFLSYHDDCSSPIFIVLPDFDIEAMFSVLYYIYNGEVFLTRNKMKSFLDIVTTLQIFVDEEALAETKETVFEMNIHGKLLNLPIDAYRGNSNINIECNESKAYVTIRKNKSSAIAVEKIQKPLDFEDKEMQCCNQNIVRKPFENLHSPNMGRQRKSCLRDSFIETYPRNCYANGPPAVPAMLSRDYLDPTSVLLVNANDDHRPLDLINGASEPYSHSAFTIAAETSGFVQDYRDQRIDKSTRNYEQSNKIMAAGNDNISVPFTSSCMPSKEKYNNSQIEANSVKAKPRTRIVKTILNAVQKNPWSAQQPICFKPLRKKDNIKKIELSTVKNDSNNNNTQQPPPKVTVEEDVNFMETTTTDIVNNPNTVQEIKCNVCFQGFSNEESLAAHSKTHSCAPRYLCTECNKTFSQLRNYKYHMSVHRGTKEFAATCSVCGKYFNDRGYLSSHMKIHRNRKEYKCSQCPKSFNQRVAYNMHVKIHTGIKPHVCEECGKAFSRKMLLKQHQRTHSGERPYGCAHCGKRFADRSNMTLHLRLHTGVKPFSCTLCLKSFTKKHHLKSHLNYHTGAKPYSCPHCKLSFTQSSNMRTHMKKCIPEGGSVS